MTPVRLLAAALVLGAAALPATAAPLMSNNCRVNVHCYELDGHVYATAVIDATWGLFIDGDMHLNVNGQEVKVEPVQTNDVQVITTRVAPAGVTITACARVIGRNVVTNEHWLPADTTDCAFFSSESPVAPNLVDRTLPGTVSRLPARTRTPTAAR